MKYFTGLGLLAIFFFGFSLNRVRFEHKEKLSQYNFFEGSLANLDPVNGVIPYNVNTPLFSNYSEKLRFIRLPEGSAAVYNDTGVFDFPEGTVLIKNFFYPNDMRDHSRGRQIIETRLLVKEREGWQPYPYIWNKEQTEAIYDPAGETTSVTYVNRSGKKIKSPYVIPNKNQCRGCHTTNNRLMPIGVSARQINRVFEYRSGKKNQLEHWKEIGLLRELPSNAPALAVWDDAESGTLDQRARAYLDANCAHCHSRSGAANTSGLYLDIFETNPTHLGVFKPPVAAGRGAGDLKFDIKPGEPQHSIMIFRMKTNDPAIAMPEIGREQVHSEGVALIEEWIRKNSFSKN
jgi:uncharacterized repeat protein (TIGR03806 family)